MQLIIIVFVLICRNVTLVTLYYWQDDNVWSFEVIFEKYREQQPLWIVMRFHLILGLWSLDFCASVSALLKAFTLSPSITAVSSPNLPFTHFILFTSLSCCVMVVQSLLFPAVMKTQGCYTLFISYSDQHTEQCVSDYFFREASYSLRWIWKYLSWRGSMQFGFVSVPVRK